MIEIIKVVKEWVVGVAMLDWPGQVVDQTFGKLAGLTVIEQVVNLPKIKYVIQVISKVCVKRTTCRYEMHYKADCNLSVAAFYLVSFLLHNNFAFRQDKLSLMQSECKGKKDAHNDQPPFTGTRRKEFSKTCL